MLEAGKTKEEMKAIFLQFLPSMSDQNSQAPGSDLGSVSKIDDEIFGNSGV